MRALIAGMVLACAGCGAMSQVDRDAREYRREDYRVQFLEYERRCRARGGLMRVDAVGGKDRDGVPGYGSRYSCERR